MAERFRPNTTQELVDAVHLWITNRQEALRRFQDVNDWDTSQITDMSELFSNNTNNHAFNSPIDRWDTSNVTDMYWMFNGNRRFNQPLNTWNVSQVKDMGHMFAYAKAFNQPLNNWDVGQVKDMNSMFAYTDSFNQPLNDWNVSQVRYMTFMFNNALSFNQPLDRWITSSVQIMESMFYHAKRFNQPLDMWDVHNVEEHNHIFDGADAFDHAREPHFNSPEYDDEEEEDEEEEEEDESEDEDAVPVSVPVPVTITQYNNVETIPLPTISKPLTNDQTAFDFISGEDIPVQSYLQESNDNLVFEFNRQFFAVSKSSILEHIIPNNANIKYKCPTVNSMRNVVKTVPYLSLRSMGIMAGVCLLGEIKTVLTNQKIQWVQIGNEVIESLPSTASLSVLLPGANYVSASHCQEGQGEQVRTLAHVITESSITGGKKIRKTSKKIRRTKRRTNKRRRTKRTSKRIRSKRIKRTNKSKR